MKPIDAFRNAILANMELIGGRHDESDVYGGVPGDPGLAGGPDSLSWELHGDLGILGMAGTAAILMQLLHPSVMAGAYNQSSYRTQPLRRARNTLGYVLRTTFGTTSAATAVIEQVKGIHERVQGTRPDGVPYRALDPKLIAWVHTCIPWAVMTAYDRHRRPLSRAERDRYLAEQAPIGRMAGADWVPTSVAELEAFVDRLRPELAANEQFRSFVHFLAEAPMVRREPGRLERAHRWAGLRASMTLMPAWAADLAGLQHTTRAGRTLARTLERAKADLARWAQPTPPCKHLALARFVPGTGPATQITPPGDGPAQVRDLPTPGGAPRHASAAGGFPM